MLPARIEDRQGGFSVHTDDSHFCSYCPVQHWHFIETWITPSVDKVQVLQFAEGYFWLFYAQSSFFLINAQKLFFFQMYPFVYWEVRWFLESFLLLYGVIQTDHVNPVRGWSSVQLSTKAQILGGGTFESVNLSFSARPVQMLYK